MSSIESKMSPLESKTPQPSEVKAPPPSEFDTSLRALIKTAIELHDEVNGRSVSKPQSLWMIRISNFMSAYTKANNPDGFKGMFNRFFSLHTADLCEDIFTPDKDVNDEWLRSKENKEVKGSAKKQRDSWSPSQATCKGHVIYFDEARKSVSIPISEIYNVAVNYAKDKAETDIHAFSYPMRILLHLYSTLNYAIPDLDSDKPKITENMNVLKEEVVKITPPPESESKLDLGEGFAGLPKMMSSIIKQSGLNVDQSQLENAMKSTFTGKTGETVGKVITKVVDTLKNSKGGDLSSVVSDITRDPELGSLISSTLKEASAQAASLASSIPSADNPSGAPLPTPIAPPAAVASAAPVVLAPENQD